MVYKNDKKINEKKIKYLTLKNSFRISIFKYVSINQLIY
jgi:hypothetical protein